MIKLKSLLISTLTETKVKVDLPQQLTKLVVKELLNNASHLKNVLKNTNINDYKFDNAYKDIYSSEWSFIDTTSNSYYIIDLTKNSTITTGEELGITKYGHVYRKENFYRNNNDNIGDLGIAIKYIQITEKPLPDKILQLLTQYIDKYKLTSEFQFLHEDITNNNK